MLSPLARLPVASRIDRPNVERFGTPRGNTLRPPLARLRSASQFDSPAQPATLQDTERALICRTLKPTNGIIDGPRGTAALLGPPKRMAAKRAQQDRKRHEVVTKLDC